MHFRLLLQLSLQVLPGLSREQLRGLRLPQLQLLYQWICANRATVRARCAWWVSQRLLYVDYLSAVLELPRVLLVLLGCLHQLQQLRGGLATD